MRKLPPRSSRVQGKSSIGRHLRAFDGEKRARRHRGPQFDKIEGVVKKPQQVGMLSIIAALLVPSWWVLPQVLAGLGVLAVVSATCAVWLERLQPVFAVVSLAALVYQGWLVWRRPGFRRTRTVLAILWASIAINLIVFVSWILLWLRYR